MTHPIKTSRGINFSRAGAGQTMTVPAMRALLEQIYHAVQDDIELGDVALHVKRAINEIDCVTAIAVQVAREVDSEHGRAVTHRMHGSKLC